MGIPEQPPQDGWLGRRPSQCRQWPSPPGTPVDTDVININHLEAVCLSPSGTWSGWSPWQSSAKSVQQHQSCRGWSGTSRARSLAPHSQWRRIAAPEGCSDPRVQDGWKYIVSALSLTDVQNHREWDDHGDYKPVQEAHSTSPRESVLHSSQLLWIARSAKPWLKTSFSHSQRSSDGILVVKLSHLAAMARSWTRTSRNSEPRPAER